MNAMHNLPNIAIHPADYERLSNLAVTAQRTNPEVADYLARELERATVTSAADAGQKVRMGSQVVYRDDDTAQVRTIRLVYPFEADSAIGHISVLTPIGAALIGLSEGHSISWTARNGGARQLTVVAVQNDLSARYCDM